MTDTRPDTATNRLNRNRRHAQFFAGAAFYSDAGNFRYGQHNGRTDVDQHTITLQKGKHKWFVSDSIKLMPQRTASFWHWTYIESLNVANPGDWWVAGVTYSGYGKDRLEHQIRAVTEWNIPDQPITAREVNYRESTTWGNDERGFWAPWPW